MDRRPATPAMRTAPRPGLDRRFDCLGKDQFLLQRLDAGRDLLGRRRLTQFEVTQSNIVMPFDLTPDRDHAKAGRPTVPLEQV
jgi:hypothetical protein